MCGTIHAFLAFNLVPRNPHGIATRRNLFRTQCNSECRNPWYCNWRVPPIALDSGRRTCTEYYRTGHQHTSQERTQPVLRPSPLPSEPRKLLVPGLGVVLIQTFQALAINKPTESSCQLPSPCGLHLVSSNRIHRRSAATQAAARLRGFHSPLVNAPSHAS